MDHDRPSKRLKLDDATVDTRTLRKQRAAFLDSLSRPVSPPGRPTVGIASSQRVHTQSEAANSLDAASSPPQQAVTFTGKAKQASADTNHQRTTLMATPNQLSNCLPSPIQLTSIADLAPSENTDTVGLRDILGDPLIKEAWIFNFCFDIDWLMQYFDQDVRDTIQVKIVHGSWKREDPRKLHIDEACSRRPNVSAVQAYLPDAFGTHHSKMFVLLRHDDLAQVVIHTANMLSKDWTNMTQAVWRSPLLPLSKPLNRDNSGSDEGDQFKSDLVRYLKAYGSKLKPLIQQIQQYDFRDVRAALVASVPSRFKASATDDEVWGYEMLRRKLGKIELSQVPQTSTSHFVFQVSSIASLPSTWLENTLYSACNATKSSTSVVFPTAPDVAGSLDGYAAGGSIHTKAQTPAHLKQISAMKSQLCRWTKGPIALCGAGRDLAAPHIKTYIRFASKPDNDRAIPDIDWALVTSANLSTQAWGSAPKMAKGEKDSREATVHIQSYEIGVLVWPDLYRKKLTESKNLSKPSSTRMIPTFKSDTATASSPNGSLTTGFRMPYDLPLTPYKADELPWSPQSNYYAPDRHGVIWQ